jgi:hypothetical protein
MDSLQDLHWELGMNRAETKDLIARYFVEKLKEQERYEENKFGTISVRVYYNTDAEILSVEGVLPNLVFTFLKVNESV